METKERPGYYAIIPANVRYDKTLTMGARLLYGEITALCNKKGHCWASNKYFAELYDTTSVTISKWISQLVTNGYINREIEYQQGTKQIKKRHLIIADPIKENFNTPIKENFNTPIKENFKDNNTVNNNTVNNIYKKKTKEPNPQIKILHDKFLELHPNKEDYIPDCGKERKLIQSLLKQVSQNGKSEKIIIDRYKIYFQNNFYNKVNWNLGTFVKNFNQFVLRQKEQSAPKPHYVN